MFRHITKTAFRAKPAGFFPARMSTLTPTASTSASPSPARTEWLPPSPGSISPPADIIPALLASVAEQVKTNTQLRHCISDHILSRSADKSALRNSFTALNPLATELHQLKAFQQKHEPALQQLQEFREYVAGLRKAEAAQRLEEMRKCREEKDRKMDAVDRSGKTSTGFGAGWSPSWTFLMCLGIVHPCLLVYGALIWLFVL